MYAVQGFVDSLREQLNLVRHQQMDVTWRNYVHETLASPNVPSGPFPSRFRPFAFSRLGHSGYVNLTLVVHVNIIIGGSSATLSKYPIA